jgi:hypothetical protein
MPNKNEQEKQEPLTGVYPDDTVVKMEIAAMELGLPFKKGGPGTELCRKGDPLRKTVVVVPEGHAFVTIEGRRPSDYTSLWDKIKNVTV